MAYRISRQLWICILQFALLAPSVALADTEHPLEPLDLSSPRATLHSFLMTGDALFRLLRDEYRNSPSRTVAERMRDLGIKAENTLDMSNAPPAARFEMGRDETIYR